MRHMSNRERIARAAEEARLAEAEKAAKKVARPAAPSRARRTAEPVRMKIVWEVTSAAGKTIKTFPYAEKSAAEAATLALSQSTGHTHILRPTKVPME